MPAAGLADPTAAHHEDLTGHAPGLGAAQPHHQRGHILGGAAIEPAGPGPGGRREGSPSCGSGAGSSGSSQHRPDRSPGSWRLSSWLIRRRFDARQGFSQASRFIRAGGGVFVAHGVAELHEVHVEADHIGLLQRVYEPVLAGRTRTVLVTAGAGLQRSSPPQTSVPCRSQAFRWSTRSAPVTASRQDPSPGGWRAVALSTTSPPST